MLTRRQSGLAVVGSFVFLHEADVARALLESYGIECWLLDEIQVQQRWYLANALGGVKLAVAPAHAYRARELLGEDHSAALDEIPESELPAHPSEQCPQCGGGDTRVSERLRLPGPFGWLVSLGFLIVGFLVPRRRIEQSYSCSSCSHAWTTFETR